VRSAGRSRGDEQFDLRHCFLEVTLADLVLQIRTPRYAVQQQRCLRGRVLQECFSGLFKLGHVLFISWG
jgi:hypothetical protein